MINIVNSHTHPEATGIPIYRSTPLGNLYDWKGSPLAKFRVANRAEAIEKYAEWFPAQVKAGNEAVLGELRKIWRQHRSGSVNLICFCSPRDCHGRIIKEWILQKEHEHTGI